MGYKIVGRYGQRLSNTTYPTRKSAEKGKKRIEQLTGSKLRHSDIVKTKKRKNSGYFGGFGW